MVRTTPANEKAPSLGRCFPSNVSTLSILHGDRRREASSRSRRSHRAFLWRLGRRHAARRERSSLILRRLAGNDVATFPDFPAEIRAPRGTKAGVSRVFKSTFPVKEIFTPGDTVDALVAMNPAALSHQYRQTLRQGRHPDLQTRRRVRQEGPRTSRLQAVQSTRRWESWQDRLQGLHSVDMTKLTRAGRRRAWPQRQKEADRCRNFLRDGPGVLGMYDRSLDPTLRFIEAEVWQAAPKWRRRIPRALKAGYNYGETVEATTHAVPGRQGGSSMPGKYRNMMGNHRASMGSGDGGPPLRHKRLCSWGRIRSRRRATSCTKWPSTSSSTCLTFQAEDEIAAVTSQQSVRRSLGRWRSPPS